MKCELCGAKVPEDERFCPSCGGRVDKDAVRDMDSDGTDEIVIDSLSCEPEFEECDTHPQKSVRKKTVLICAVAAMLVAATLTTLILTGVLGGMGANTVVVTVGGEKLTNAQLAYYYWGEYFYWDNAYAQYGMSFAEIVDKDTPFSEQPFVNDDWPTWHEFFLNAAIENWVSTVALGAEAARVGHEMDLTYVNYLDSLDETVNSEAVEFGFYSADAMIKADYGKYSGLEGYRKYLEQQYMAYSYLGEIYNGFYSDTSGNIEMTPSVNVRHILFGFEERGDQAKTLAEEVYNEWKAVGTEDYFSQLAGEHTDDPGSVSNGGLYAGVAPGEMVEPFDSWCFDESRQIGDSGIVETSYGFHIMFYSGTGSEVPKNPDDVTAAEDAAQAAYNAYIDELIAALGERVVYEDKMDLNK